MTGGSNAAIFRWKNTGGSRGGNQIYMVDSVSSQLLAYGKWEITQHPVRYSATRGKTQHNPDPTRARAWTVHMACWNFLLPAV